MNLHIRWWRTYECFRCGAVFSGRRGPWLWQYRLIGKINYLRREWRYWGEK